jgi:hypothetical protein
MNPHLLLLYLLYLLWGKKWKQHNQQKQQQHQASINGSDTVICQMISAESEVKMGGFGSGRFHQNGKAVTEHVPSLDVRRLKRKGLLVPGTTSSLRWSHSGRLMVSLALRAANDRVLLSTQTPGADETQNQWVELDQTPCPLGGSRIWFRCPAQGCGRRVAILYGGVIFACRHCHQLAYASQREEGYVRAVRKMDRLRDKLDWGPGIISGDRSRPKGMHRLTFARLAAEHDGLVRRYVAGMSRRFEGLGENSD